MTTSKVFKRACFALALAVVPFAAASASADSFDGVDPQVLTTYQRVLTANEIDQRCQVFSRQEREALSRLLASLDGQVFNVAVGSAQIQSRRSTVVMLQAILRDRIEQEFAAGGCDTVLDGLTVVEPALTHGGMVHEVKALF